MTSLSAAIAMSGSRVRTASGDCAAIAAPISRAVLPGSALPVTWTVTTSPPDSAMPSLAPAQRSCRPMLLTSCRTHSTFFDPPSASFWPAPTPATRSLWPTWVITLGICSSRSDPELSVTIGMPAASASARALEIAPMSGADTARPSAPWFRAALIISDCCLASPAEPW